MSININSKSSLVIAGSAAAAGAVIFVVSKGVELLRNRKTNKDTPEPEVHEVQVADDAPIKKMAEEK